MLNDKSSSPALRHNWQPGEAIDLFELPFNDLLYQAHSLHRALFDPNTVQQSTLINIKTGACPEDCAYCSQSARYKSGLKAEKLMAVAEVAAAAKAAKDNGATRFCMGAAWRSPGQRDLKQVVEMVRVVKALGMETCATLGMLEQGQAQQLKQAGLDYYNHNIDTSPQYYSKIITTRAFQERLDTLDQVRDAGIKVCCGGIVGLGESRQDRAEMLRTLANLEPHPESVPINNLVPIPGTPLANAGKIDAFEFVRTIAVARILMPQSWVRLSAGRDQMSDELQALCFFAGANSLFYGDRLLTADNADVDHDQALFQRLGLRPHTLPNP